MGSQLYSKFKNFNSLLMYIDRLSQSLNTTPYELTPIKITKFKMMQPNRNINRNLKTTKTVAHKRKICQLGQVNIIHNHLITIQSK